MANPMLNLDDKMYKRLAALASGREWSVMEQISYLLSRRSWRELIDAVDLLRGRNRVGWLIAVRSTTRLSRARGRRRERW